MPLRRKAAKASAAINTEINPTPKANRFITAASLAGQLFHPSSNVVGNLGTIHAVVIGVKRPLGIYPIAVWCFFGLALQADSIVRLVAYCSGTVPDNDLKSHIKGIIVFLALWHVFRLVQLKNFNRLLTIVFFAFWTVTLFINNLTLLQRSPRPSRVMLILAVFAFFNLGSIRYLSRKSFRDTAARFVQERDSYKNFQMMEKISQGRIRKDLRA